jgi:large subunit ribosomal protein L6
MSRVGRNPIKIPSGVSVAAKDNHISVKGPRGELERTLHPDMILDIGKEVIVVKRPSEAKLHKSLHGLTRTLISNMVEGVSKGFIKELEVEGVEYRVELKGKALVMALGYSHPVRYTPSEGITVEVPDPKRIRVSGIDKQKVGQAAAEIRAFRPPEPYKGKGIRYAGELIRRKAGKAAVGTGF